MADLTPDEVLDRLDQLANAVPGGPQPEFLTKCGTWDNWGVLLSDLAAAAAKLIRDHQCNLETVYRDMPHD